MKTKGELLQSFWARSVFEEPVRHIRRVSFLTDVWNHLRDRWRMSKMLQPIYCKACKIEHARAVKRWSLWDSSTYIGRRYLPYGNVNESTE